MAGIKSGFITGARAKVKIGSKVVAFATDVSYDVRVETIPVEAMGKYEVFTNEPVGYYVNGGFTVVRYTSADGASSTVLDQNANGNKASQIGDGSPKTHIDPQQILESATFDLDIYEKTSEESELEVWRIKDCRINSRRATLNKRGVLMDSYTFVGVLGGDATTDGIDVGNSTVGDDGE